MNHEEDTSGKDQTAVNHVFYFSGTGNSYHVAKTLAGRIGAILAPIVTLQEGALIEADLLCFVFPVYDFKPPGIVIERIENLENISANHVIAIGTQPVQTAFVESMVFALSGEK